MDMPHVHIHLDSIDHLAQSLHQDLHQLLLTLQQGFARMSDASDQLTAAVTGVQTSVDSFNTTLQAEMAQIATALANTGTGSDPALQQAAADAVTRLNALAAQMDQLNTTVQEIIP